MAGIKTDTGRDRRLKVLEEVRSFRRSNGYMPTISELVELTGIPRSSLEHHLNHLRTQGFVTWVDGARARTFAVTSKRKDLLE